MASTSSQWTPDRRLPPVLPIVLYNGNRRWDAPEEIGDLIVPVPGGLERYRPSLRYLLLDEGRFAESDLAPLRNLAAALFRLENSRTPQDVERVLAALVEWLKAPEQASLRRAFTVWMKRVFLPGRMPGIEVANLNELQEVQSMLAERVVEWTEEWKRQGWAQGLADGRQEGRQEGEAAMLLRLLERRCGLLDEPLRQSIRAADVDTVMQWGDPLWTAESLADVLGEGSQAEQ